MSRAPFPSMRVAGGLLAADLFSRVLDDEGLEGRDPAAYQLGPHERVREAASRAFEYLAGTWPVFSRDLEKAQNEGRPVTGLTRERWLLVLLRELGFGLVPATPAGGLVVDGKGFRVSHQWNHVPIHLLGWGTDLDHRTKGVAGAADAAPQSMVQELLNRDEGRLWALVSNGQRWRLLRDSRALAGSAYVEFDLELIFAEQLFSDFLLLFRLVHASRFAAPDGESVAHCWLERWRTAAIEQGERALARLRTGVRGAIETLGTGFVRHPENASLRDSLAAGHVSVTDYQRAVLRLVYRMLFWFVAEDRGVLLDPDASRTRAERYDAYFSARRLRERARRGGFDAYDDRWDAVRLVFTALGSEPGCPELALPGIGGLFERVTVEGGASTPDALDEPLEGLRLSNEALLTAVRHLAWVDSEGRQRSVDFKNLDSEELGSVYESLLDLHPAHDASTGTFALAEAAGSERKTTGSYYTPSSLTEALLDSALDPLLDQALSGSARDTEAQIEALLSVTVCDPACGSGHFLVAAARRIARRVAQVRSGEEEPSPDLVRTAMREVVSRCVHGVDINEMAAELAKVSLWLESVEPGRPLAFLDANIRVGNTLLGTTPALLAAGIPNEAFKPITGDDRAAARHLAKVNREEGAGQLDLYGGGALDVSNLTLGKRTEELVRIVPARLSDVAVQGRRLRAVDAERRAARRVADAWCAAFVQEMQEETAWEAVTQGTLNWIGSDSAEWTDPARQRTVDMVGDLAQRYRFFHWHLEFPHIFEVPEDGSPPDAPGWQGGFTCVLGNPPWERVKLQEKEFFAARHEGIAKAPNAAARKKLIAALKDSEGELEQRLFQDFRAELRFADGWSHLLRESGRYPLTGRGDINTYAVFAETGRIIISGHGRVGMVLPTGIATEATTQHFFKDMVTSETLVSLYDFENEEKIFPSITNRVRFCLWTGSGGSARQERIDLAFCLRRVGQLADRRFSLTPPDIELLNPNTGTCPAFEHRRNADIIVGVYRRIPILWRDGDEYGNLWDLSFLRMFDMANDSELFNTREALEANGWTLDGNVFDRGSGERMLPLYEAKMLHHFDDRFATYADATQAQLNKGTLPRATPDQKSGSKFDVMPESWIERSRVGDRLLDKRRNLSWRKSWLFGWRDIARSSDERTVIAAALPRAAVGHTMPLVFSDRMPIAGLYANLASFVLDYVARQKMAGSHLTYMYVKQFPILAPDDYLSPASWDDGKTLGVWVTARVLELAYTSYGMEGFAQDHGDDGPPYEWDEERRFWLRAELDAAYFHLYGVERDDVDYVMDTFRAFRNNDPERFARTKQAILDIYDEMATAVASGTRYQTRLDPPPGEGPRHPPK